MLFEPGKQANNLGLGNAVEMPIGPKNGINNLVPKNFAHFSSVQVARRLKQPVCLFKDNTRNVAGKAGGIKRLCRELIGNAFRIPVRAFNRARKGINLVHVHAIRVSNLLGGLRFQTVCS